MDLNVNTNNENIRKIEDIIDIQKANGKYSARQVAFNLPSDAGSTVSANLARSLESGLSNSKTSNKKKLKKHRSKRYTSPLPDVVSWPSDSDITVLRMKVCRNSKDLKENVKNPVPGDGLHQPDSSSMINLATLMRQSQPTSKQNLNNMEEYLLPLTSWEREQDTEPEIKQHKVEEEIREEFNKINEEFGVYDTICSHNNIPGNLSSMNSQSGFSKITTKSKVARFLRLYFCPCCTCLYKLERMRDDPSVYFTNRKDQLNV